MGSRALLRPRGRLSILSGAAGPREAEADAAPSESANSHPLDAALRPTSAVPARRVLRKRPPAPFPRSRGRGVTSDVSVTPAAPASGRGGGSVNRVRAALGLLGVRV